MAGELQCATVVYRVAPGQLWRLTWGTPIFGTASPTGEAAAEVLAPNGAGGPGTDIFCGLVAQHQPPQPRHLLDQGKILLRIVTHGVCVAPPAAGAGAYTVGRACVWGSTGGAARGGAYVLGVQHDSGQLGKLYRLLVRSGLLLPPSDA